MTSPDDHGIHHRASVRSARPVSAALDDEDYDLDAMAVADGYRPSDPPVAHDHVRHPEHVAATTLLSTPSLMALTTNPPTASASAPPRPSSIAKPKMMDSFALRHEGGVGPLSSGPSFANHAPVQHASNTATEPAMQQDGPYAGPAEPSHPYEMYPQTTRLERTASMATDATAPMTLDRAYHGPTGPTHPYILYPQNTVDEGPEDAALPSAQIPLGFTGMQTTYHRGIGPDGEDSGDIIGPDGHTEQLPPYSRYPQEGLGSKAGAVIVPQPSPASSSSTGNTSPTMSGAGGIGLATRDPAFASRENLSPIPNSRHSTRSETSEGTGSHVPINLAAMGAAEKKPPKAWQRVAGHKICGVIPMWVMIVAAICCFCLGIILGAVLAVVGPGHRNKGDSDDDAPTATVTTTVDASSLSVIPTNLPSLPLGDFALSLSTPYSSESACITDPSQVNAWSCQVPPSSLEMSVQSDRKSNNGYMIGFGLSNISVPGTYLYGSQPPVIQPQQLVLVKDLSQAYDWGPAWFFQIPYTKLVIVDQDALSSSQTKRSWGDIDLSRKGVVQDGDQPWFCYWNGTLLETFVYVNESSSWASSSTTTTPASSTPTSTPTSQTPPERRHVSGTQTNTLLSATGWPEVSQIPFLKPYPKAIKVEERRVAHLDNDRPYCQQMRIASDGSAQPVRDAKGNDVIIDLEETDPSGSSKRSVLVNIERAPGERELAERGTPVEARQSAPTCSCVWVSN